jgi:hypothetical protein
MGLLNSTSFKQRVMMEISEMVNVNTNKNENLPAGFPGSAQPVKRGRGRPPGSKNKPKFFVQPQEPAQEGWIKEEKSVEVGKKPSVAVRRKWQRDWIRPQFSLSRKEALELFVRYLRSGQGKIALREIINEGFVGIAKLPDISLGKYLEKTHLLSRYPHDVVIK